MRILQKAGAKESRALFGAGVLVATGALFGASQLTASATVPAKAPAAASTASTTSAASAAKPTIVLVHGAWADASSWNSVITDLQKEGFTVYAPPNPLRGVAYDAETISDFISTIPGPVVLVGHSYGGMVITNVTAPAGKIKALVYDDAYIPDQGETVFQINAAIPGSCVAADPSTFLNFAPYPGAPAGSVDAYLKVAPSGAYAGFDGCFANGVPAAKAALLAVGQRPFAVAAGSEPSGPPAWKTIPSWDVVGTADHVILPAEQLAMAQRAGSHVTKVDAGHLSLLTKSDAVAQVITEAAR